MSRSSRSVTAGSTPRARNAAMMSVASIPYPPTMCHRASVISMRASVAATVVWCPIVERRQRGVSAVGHRGRVGGHSSPVRRPSRGVPRVVQRGPVRARPSAIGSSVAQTNVSTSAAGVVRGIHFADVPPGQAKYVTCVTGARARRRRGHTRGFPDVRRVGGRGPRRRGAPRRLPERGPRARLHVAGGRLGRHLPVFYALQPRPRTRDPPTRSGDRNRMAHARARRVARSSPGFPTKDAGGPTLSELREAGLLPTARGGHASGGAPCEGSRDRRRRVHRLQLRSPHPRRAARGDGDGARRAHLCGQRGLASRRAIA